MAGRITLINAVLTTLPLFYLSFFRAPLAMINRLTAIQRNFLWGGNLEGKKIAWVAWSQVCASRERVHRSRRIERRVNRNRRFNWRVKRRVNRSRRVMVMVMSRRLSRGRGRRVIVVGRRRRWMNRCRCWCWRVVVVVVVGVRSTCWWVKRCLCGRVRVRVRRWKSFKLFSNHTTTHC